MRPAKLFIYDKLFIEILFSNELSNIVSDIELHGNSAMPIEYHKGTTYDCYVCIFLLAYKHR